MLPGYLRMYLLTYTKDPGSTVKPKYILACDLKLFRRQFSVPDRLDRLL